MFHGQKKGVQHESTGDGGTRGRRREVEEVSTAPVSTSLKRWREPYDLLISSPIPRFWKPSRAGTRSLLMWMPQYHMSLGISHSRAVASLVAQRLKRLPAMPETWVRSLGQEDPLEKEMATYSSILAWTIPWTEEPGELQSTGSQRVGHDWVSSLSLHPQGWGLSYSLLSPQYPVTKTNWLIEQVN